jgi:Mrp family chromosome partitioning ATPase
MSLIEIALNKIQRQAAETAHKPVTQPSPRGKEREVVRRPEGTPASAAAAAKARKFAEVPLDPHILERNCILPQIEDQSALRAYKILRTRLLQRMVSNNWYSIAVTGSTTGEGKTLTAINLAIALAQDVNTWVFLVDLDLQRPQVANYLGMEFGKGLGDYLTGDAGIDEILYNPVGMERLAVIPNSRSFRNSSELLVSPRMIELTHALAAEAPRRIVIFDMPPLLASDDALAFAPQVDGLLMVLAEGISLRGSMEKSKQLIGQYNLIGVVLNQSAESNDSPYY